MAKRRRHFLLLLCFFRGFGVLQGDQLAGMWTATLPLGLEGKMAALQAALEFIGTPPPPVASARTGTSPVSSVTNDHETPLLGGISLRSGEALTSWLNQGRS